LRSSARPADADLLFRPTREAASTSADCGPRSPDNQLMFVTEQFSTNLDALAIAGFSLAR
jgi:hypothetical protein